MYAAACIKYPYIPTTLRALNITANTARIKAIKINTYSLLY